MPARDSRSRSDLRSPGRSTARGPPSTLEIAATWTAIVGYRPWPALEYPKAAARKIEQLSVPLAEGEVSVYESRQFRLVRAGEEVSAGR